MISSKYRLVRCLGEGGMGTVWEALNVRTQRPFALKLMKKSAELSAELRERMLREASVAGRLLHPNVIEVYDVGETESGDPFLVMELLRGVALDELLVARGQLEPEAALAIAREIASALSAAHSAGVLHRDLKPANVFLNLRPDGVRGVKVLDFGVSKLTEATEKTATVTGSPIGTPAYMSPEQAEGRRDLDGRSDLWSLGVLLFEMLTGKLPFDGPSAYAVVAAVLHAEVPHPSSCVTALDPRLDAIVMRCLTRDRARRFGSADELRSELEKLLSRPAHEIIAALGLPEITVPSARAPVGVVSDTATTGLVAPRLPQPSAQREARGRRLWPWALSGIVALFAFGILAGTLWQRGATVEPAELVVSDPPASAGPSPSESATLGSAPLPVSSPAPSASSKRVLPRGLPCPKDKLLIDPVTGKPTCASLRKR
ncbi:MAG: serine/threonine-protein kinase [Polyangiaceae bacterium]